MFYAIKFKCNVNFFKITASLKFMKLTEGNICIWFPLLSFCCLEKSREVVLVIVNSRLRRRPQKQNRGNQVIYKHLTGTNSSGI